MSVAGTGAMAKILVVDDEANVRNVLTLFLTKKGHDVTCAEDGEVALPLLRANQALLSIDSFDVLITDIVMPRMDGLSLICSRDVIDPCKTPDLLSVSQNGHGILLVDENLAYEIGEDVRYSGLRSTALVGCNDVERTPDGVVQAVLLCESQA